MKHDFTTLWTWFSRCALEDFVNCTFGMAGACKNPRHRREG